MSSPNYIIERNAELYMRYYEARKHHPHRQSVIIAMSSPASHYWVSFYEVYREILNKLHGRKPSKKTNAKRQQQIDDIWRIYQELADKPTFKGCSVFFIVQFAISGPAPEFYLSFSRAQAIIYRTRKEYDIREV